MLGMDPVVKINLDIDASAVVSENFYEIGAIIGGTIGKISIDDRYKVYASLEEVLNGVEDEKPAYANTTPEYLAAAKYFAVTPAPTGLVIIYCNDVSNFPTFSAEDTYAVGDQVLYSTKYYVCKTAITTAAAWDAEKWNEVTPETPASALADAITKGASFYGVYLAIGDTESDATRATAIGAIDDAMNSFSRGVQFYGALGTVDDPTGTGATSLFTIMNAKETRRSIGMLCAAKDSSGATDNGGANDAAGLMGVAMGYAHLAADRNFALAYKDIESATPISGLNASQIATVKSKNGNVYVQRTRTISCVENGATAQGMRFDEVLYLDRIAAEIQETCFEIIASSEGKLAQEDSTTELFLSGINTVLDSYNARGVLSTDDWRGAPIGSIGTGDPIPNGYLAFADSFTEQSAEDRRDRKAMPITVLLCLTGSVESVVINLKVQQ